MLRGQALEHTVVTCRGQLVSRVLDALMTLGYSAVCDSLPEVASVLLGSGGIGLVEVDLWFLWSAEC